MAIQKTITVGGKFQLPAHVVIGQAQLDYLRGVTTVNYIAFSDADARGRHKAATAALEPALNKIKALECECAKLDNMPGRTEQETAEKSQAYRDVSARLQEAQRMAVNFVQAANELIGGNIASATFPGLIIDRAQLYDLSKQNGMPLEGGTDC